MHLKQLLCTSSNHRFIKAYGTWRDGGQGKTSRYCVAYYVHNFFYLHNLNKCQLFPLLFLFIAERYLCMCKEGTVFVNSAKRVPIWIYTVRYNCIYSLIFRHDFKFSRYINVINLTRICLHPLQSCSDRKKIFSILQYINTYILNPN